MALLFSLGLLLTYVLGLPFLLLIGISALNILRVGFNYVLSIVGAALIALCLPSLFWIHKWLRRRFTAAVRDHQAMYSLDQVASKVLAALFLNLLVFTILIFGQSRTAAESLSPLSSLVLSGLPSFGELRQTLPYAIFLFLFSGSLGPITIRVIEVSRISKTRLATTLELIQIACYVSWIVLLISFSSGTLNFADPTDNRVIFLHVVSGIVIPSTFANIAFFELFSRIKLLARGLIMILVIMLYLTLGDYFTFGFGVTITNLIMDTIFILILCLALAKRRNLLYETRMVRSNQPHHRKVK